ncbi:MAG: hypothetical protein KDD14_03445 [Saprospiraceae bacterium]|nr:hypothetical protein [Saprospiraceae bacterium]
MANRYIQRITQLIALALLAHIALSWPLWFPSASRSIPLTPLITGLFPENIVFNVLQISALILLTGFVLWFPNKQTAKIGLIAMLLWLVLQDTNRLQPWLYFYLLSLCLIVAGRNQSDYTVWGLRLVLAAVYAWGGFNKLTPFFAEDNFPWFCEAFVWTKPLGKLPMFGYAVAAVEFIFAPGLLWAKTRPVFRWLVVGFHLFIALAISPLGLNWNTIVIPWNLSMAGMVWLLFDPKMQITVEHYFELNRSRITSGMVLLLAWVFPALNIFHVWDEALSWKMYSNTQTEASFYARIPINCGYTGMNLDPLTYDQGRKLLLDDWAIKELHVPAYNNRRTQQQLARYLCNCIPNPDSAGLLILTVDRWDYQARHWEEIPCKLIKK